MNDFKNFDTSLPEFLFRNTMCCVKRSLPASNDGGSEISSISFPAKISTILSTNKELFTMLLYYLAYILNKICHLLGDAIILIDP